MDSLNIYILVEHKATVINVEINMVNVNRKIIMQ